MEIVVDASVAIKWFVREAGSQAAIKVLDDASLDLVAPDFFSLEVRNGLLKQNRLGALSDALLDRALVELETVMPRLSPAAPLVPRATALARQSGHPLYDCLYLALAEHLDSGLITADIAFIARCRDRLKTDRVINRLRDLATYETP